MEHQKPVSKKKKKCSFVLKKKKIITASIMIHICDLNTGKVDAGGLWVWGHPELNLSLKRAINKQTKELLCGPFFPKFDRLNAWWHQYGQGRLASLSEKTMVPEIRAGLRSLRLKSTLLTRAKRQKQWKHQLMTKNKPIVEVHAWYSQICHFDTLFWVWNTWGSAAADEHYGLLFSFQKWEMELPHERWPPCIRRKRDTLHLETGRWSKERTG